MNNWPYRPLSAFLIEREGRFKPNDPKIASYKRLDKIDFSGKIHISEKPSKTDMIIIEPGDLVISGINVAKGALAVYDGDEPLTATIHYSSYRFNENKIDIEFLKRFLKSPAFISELQNQVKGGIKTEIKPKHLLPLKARIPELAEQQKINHYFDAVDNEISDLSNEVNTQSSYLTKLRQAILQEAVEGKLTADWRKENPVRKGDPDYDAEALLQKIQAEKEKLIKEGKIKKQKTLAPIKAEEVPFELPVGWVWTRFANVIDIESNLVQPREYDDFIQIAPDDIEKGTGHLIGERKTVKEKMIISGNHLFFAGMLLYSKVRPRLRKIAAVDFEGLCSADMYPLKPWINNTYTLNIMLSDYFDEEVYKADNRVKMPKINQNQLSTILIPVPPHAEQKAIVDRVEKLLSMVDELEKQVSERKVQSEQLMQAVLREAFEGGK